MSNTSRRKVVFRIKPARCDNMYLDSDLRRDIIKHLEKYDRIGDDTMYDMSKCVSDIRESINDWKAGWRS